MTGMEFLKAIIGPPDAKKSEGRNVTRVLKVRMRFDPDDHGSWEFDEPDGIADYFEAIKPEPVKS